MKTFIFHMIVAAGSIAYGVASAADWNDSDLINVSPKWIDAEKQVKMIKVRKAIAEMESNPYYINMIAQNDEQIKGIAE